MSAWLPRLAFLCLAGLAAGARSQEPPAPELPPPLVEYMGRPVADTMHWKGAGWLLRAEREREEATSRMIAALGLAPGQVVCDLGCGVGAITLPIAARVLPEGRVLAVDVQPEMLARLEERMQAENVTNIRGILAGPADPRLEPGSCDLVLLVDVYHELGYPVEVLAAVRKALKPRGRLVLVEFRAEDPDVPIRPEHKMTRVQVERELAANGFRLARAYEDLPWQHMLFFARSDEPAEEPAEAAESSPR